MLQWIPSWISNNQNTVIWIRFYLWRYSHNVKGFVVESAPCYWMDFNGSVGLCICFAPETCAQLRLGQNIIHLHLMAAAFECGELWTTAYVCVCNHMCEKLQGQMHSAFNECGPEGTWVVKTESWQDYFCPLLPDSFVAPLHCNMPLNYSDGPAGQM